MKIVHVLLNIFTLLCCSILLYSVALAYSAHKKLDYAIQEIDKDKESTNKLILLAEQIGADKKPRSSFITKEEYLKLKSNQIDWDNKYEIAFNERQYSQDLLGRYLNHNMMILDKWKIFQDKITKELFLGTYADVRIFAEENRLFLNDNEIKANENSLYRIAKDQKANFLMEKYRLNIYEAKIDTIRTSRTIEFTR